MAHKRTDLVNDAHRTHFKDTWYSYILISLYLKQTKKENPIIPFLLKAKYN